MPALNKKPDLKPCPFCGADLDVKWNRNNPSARRVTDDCMGAKLPVICLDVPGSIDAWNARALATQSAPETLITREQHIALREAFAINSADLYFEVYPTHDNDVGRMLFERGFARGFDSHERAIETAKKGNT
jgi:hypothetical protein